MKGKQKRRKKASRLSLDTDSCFCQARWSETEHLPILPSYPRGLMMAFRLLSLLYYHGRQSVSHYKVTRIHVGSIS